MQINWANGDKPKMRERRLRSVNCNGAVKQRGVKYTGLEQGVGVYEKEIHTKRINAVCGHNVEFQNVKPDGMVTTRVN
jgi:hypothetical protein